MSKIRTRNAKAASKIRRSILGLLLRLPGSGSSDPSALLARFPEQSLLPLRRQGLDPVPAMSAIREREPVSRVKMPFGLRGWLVTGFDEARTVLAADPDTFSNDFSHMVGKVGIAAEQDPGGLGFTDPPAHTRLRHMLTATFTTRALAARAPRMKEIINEALDDVERLGADGAVVDLQKHFALTIPSRVIMELLGVDEADREEFQRLSTARFDFAEGAAASLDVIQDAIKLLQQTVERHRVSPGDGLIGSIIKQYGDEVGDVELAGLADGVLTGGLETTVSMLALGAIVLLEDRALFDTVRTDDASAEPLVEELLRYLSVVQVGFPRFAARDVTLAGKEMFPGDVILVSLSAANRDPRRGTAMDRVDITRPQNQHLAFSHGLHRCVGAELARMELRLAYPALVRRFPQLRLAVEPERLSYRELSFVYGLEELPVLLR